MSRREEAKAERRHRIIAAARDLIKETGDTGLSMRAIAARAGVSLTTPYNLFGSKRAIVIALLVLLLGVRPIAKALMKKREDATPRPAFGQTIEGAEGEDAEALTGPVVIPPVSLDQLESSRGYDERVGAVRGFTRDNPTRAALAVRDMIKADAR